MWQPSASMDAIRARAKLFAGIRQFFAQRHVMEVETPLLCQSTAMDPYLDSFSLQSKLNSSNFDSSNFDSSNLDRSNVNEYFLQTSPEFPMKRLLAAGSGPIFQIAKAFRCDEQSSRHNPEFTLLEWYQPGYSLLELQQELLDLIAALAGELECDGEPCNEGRGVTCTTYGDLFESVVGLDPHTCDVDQLALVAKQKVNFVGDGLSREAWLDLLMSHLVEPEMPKGFLVLTDFPAGQAALAEVALDANGRSVAKRLELYRGGIELANGYQELINPEEQRLRFEADNRKRKQLGYRILPIPEYLLAALDAGMPASSGIAVGLDRLLMALLGKQQLTEVLCFPWDNA